MAQPRPSRRCGALTRLLGDDGGNVALLFACFLAVGTVAGAFAVDEGSLYLERREAQAATDLAAISAAVDPAHAFARARQALADAGLIEPAISDAALAAGSGAEQLVVTTGTYVPDPGRAAVDRFTAGDATPNAVRVSFTRRGTLYFAAPWDSPPPIGVTALASATPQVSFSVGSTLATLQDGIPNAVLNALLGSDVALRAASYNGLLDAKVSLFGFLDALAQRLDIRAGSYDDVLAASASQGSIARAIADCLTGSDAAAAAALAAGLGHDSTVPLGRLLDLGEAGRLALGSGARSGYDAQISALQLLAASGAVSDGAHQVRLALAAGVPGLVRLDMGLAVGEPQQFAAWFALGPSGTLARTAQVRLALVATLGGMAGLPRLAIRVPLYLDVAYAEAGVQSATCPQGGAPGSAVIAARPGIARLILGEVAEPALADFSAAPPVAPAVLADGAALRIVGRGVAAMDQPEPTALAFAPDDIAAGTVREAQTRAIASSLAGSLLASMQLEVSAFGVGLPAASSLRAALARRLLPLGPVLDSAIDTTLAALGLGLGVADVRVYGVACRHPVLVG